MSKDKPPSNTLRQLLDAARDALVDERRKHSNAVCVLGECDLLYQGQLLVIGWVSYAQQHGGLPIVFLPDNPTVPAIITAWAWNGDRWVQSDHLIELAPGSAMADLAKMLTQLEGPGPVKVCDAEGERRN